MDIADFVASQTQLVERERDYEAEQSTALASNWLPTELQRLGFALVALRITRHTTGLGGKSLLTLEAPTPGTALLANTLRSGDIVSVTAPVNKKNLVGMHGVLTQCSDMKLTVALRTDDEVPGDWHERCSVRRLASDVTYRRMLQALRSLSERPAAAPVVRCLLGNSEPQFTEPAGEFFNMELNAQQQKAVRHAVTATDVALVHGPPGTGKTQAVVEIVRQLARNGRVLVCAPSNLAVDTLAERLGHPAVRLGHPARMLPKAAAMSLDALVKGSDSGSLLRDVRMELDQALARLPKAKRPERRELYGQIKDLRKEFRERERSVVAQTIDSARIVLATLSGAGARKLGDFHAVVIDEATQATEPECWIACIAGLPPTVTSGKPVETMFERVRHRCPNACVMLTTQYRMHEQIAKVSSQQLYENKLAADPSVAGHLLSDIAQSTDDTTTPLVLYDTAGSGMYEDTEAAGIADTDSKLNRSEAALAHAHVLRLLAADVSPRDIAVISPYNAQVRLLRELLRDHVEVEVGSVDGFQGREKEAVVLSLVRSNENQEIGFLSDYRRTNVAVTRARRHLCVIGDSETVARRSPFLNALFVHLEDNADLRYPDSM
ncbi:P-loop containing nucleoside triphosphate hydrolase protein [Linderina pennispora]|uniref:DNA helicase n=1 Tax=Linderina pennispora TaxID=61395 RepID=A0A1Y1WM32_9FUNG|nr:P-loop containing nucleoside triphosphate hydrolase protein [Linderina pennispora]ORX74425.1 P-loop containing nucleoside triphosphate hydrolase protein [Linderina pennispora]